MKPARRAVHGVALALLLAAIAAEGIALEFGWMPVDLGDLYRRNPKLPLTEVAGARNPGVLGIEAG